MLPGLGLRAIGSISTSVSVARTDGRPRVLHGAGLTSVVTQRNAASDAARRLRLLRSGPREQ
jgi:hypothetical protein